METNTITVKQAAEILQVNVQTLKRWEKLGKIQSIRHPMNNYRLYDETTIKQLAERIKGA